MSIRIVIPIVITLLGRDLAHACSCGDYPSATEARVSATAVFEGTVVERWPKLIRSVYSSPAKEDMLIPSQRYTFAVHRIWKGPTDSRIRILEGSGNCSEWFETGKKYLVFASRHETEIGAMDAHKCGGPTRESSRAATHIAELGQPIAELSLSPPVRHSQVYRVSQHASVYFWTGVAVLKFGIEHPFRAGWRICAVLGLTLAAIIGFLCFIHRRLRRPLAKTVVLGVTILALCAGATTATGYFYVYRNYGWASHLLEGWSW